MNKQRDLLYDLNITGYSDNGNSTLDIDINRVKAKVNKSIHSAYPERTAIIMKSKKKFSLIAAAATLVLGITVFAAGSGIIKSWNSYSSSDAEYKSLPTAQQCIKDIGYEPILIDTFENGYAFYEGSIVHNDLTDENNKSVEKFRSVSFRYEKDSDQVIFSQERFDHVVNNEGEIIAQINGTDVYYSSYINKFVPADYEMTEEDRKAEESGELVFSYGSPDVQVVKVQSVLWSDDNMHYLLLQIGGRLSPNELAQMAEEAIQSNNA